jgi:hypothetical protein
VNKLAIIGGSALLGAIIYNAIQRRKDVPPVYVRKSLSGNYNAITIPPFGIFITEKEKDNQALLDHEMVHWRQYQQMGLIPFYLEYARQKKEYGYDKMPLEIEARHNESLYCQTNYTDCVRNGSAVTVYNPDFRT